MSAIHVLMIGVLGPSLAGASGGETSAAPQLEREWSVVTPAEGLPHPRVNCLLATAEEVWAGTPRGLVRLRAGRWEVLTTADGLPHAAVSALALDAGSGDLWIGTFGGLARLRGGRIERFGQLDSGLANDVVYALAAHRGEVWIGTAAGISRYEAARDRWQIYEGSNSPVAEMWTTSLASRGDDVLLGTNGSGLLRFDLARERWFQLTDPDRDDRIDLLRDDGLLHDRVTAVAVEESGRAWIGTPVGLCALEGENWRTFGGAAGGMAGTHVYCLRAHDGLVWVGTESGLSVTDGARWWTAAGARAGAAESAPVPHEAVLDIAFRGEEIWLATARGLVVGRARGAAGALATNSGATAGSPGEHASAAAVGRVTPWSALPSGFYGDPAEVFFQRPMPALPGYSGGDEGAGAERSGAAIRIGVLAPLDDSDAGRLGREMVDGVRVAVQEFEAAHPDRPIELVVRPSSGLWGASSNEVVSLICDERVAAMIGTIDGADSHIALQAAAALGVPLINTANGDPALTEMGFPWVVRVCPDARRLTYALAEHVYGRLGIGAVGTFRSNNRYGEVGADQLRLAAERVGEPVRFELRWTPGQREFGEQLNRFARVGVKAIVLWGPAADCAAIVRQARERGDAFTLVCGERAVSGEFLELAGAAAEGVIAAATVDPARGGERWARFEGAYREMMKRAPGAVAAHAYDGASLLLDCVARVGGEPGRLRDALSAVQEWEGIAGRFPLDTTMNQAGPVYVATVREGAWRYEEVDLARRPAQREVDVFLRMTRRPAAESAPAAAELSVGCLLPLDEAGRAFVAGATTAVTLDWQAHPKGRPVSFYAREARADWIRRADALVDLATESRVGALILPAGGGAVADAFARTYGIPVLVSGEAGESTESVVGYTASEAAQAGAFFEAWRAEHGADPNAAATTGYAVTSRIIGLWREGKLSAAALREAAAGGR